MRIAVISDIHGNLGALDAVLADITGRGVDVTVNLGDLLSGPFNPRETAERLMKADILTVSGNHERQLLAPEIGAMGRTDSSTHARLEPRHLEWISTLPLSISPTPGVLAFHGTPTDDLQYLLHTVDESGAARASHPEEIVARIGDSAALELLLCGHTHVPGERRMPSGVLIVNPGSVGWPAYRDEQPYPHIMEAGTPHARYAIVDNASGEWAAEFVEVDYDWGAAAALAEANGRPEVAHAILTGRMPRDSR